eukprot:3833077-Pyramimonas_sp.AAC.1
MMSGQWLSCLRLVQMFSVLGCKYTELTAKLPPESVVGLCECRMRLRVSLPGVCHAFNFGFVGRPPQVICASRGQCQVKDACNVNLGTPRRAIAHITVLTAGLSHCPLVPSRFVLMLSCVPDTACLDARWALVVEGAVGIAKT